jgi:PncC family amidohydrolase
VSETKESPAEKCGALAQSIVSLAHAHNKTVATAESCTGGLVAAALTSIAGASEAYVGSVVSYANEVKAGLLGVSKETLIAVGAVSEEVALEMACGACRAVGADYAVSITGVAGPGGGTPEKPVGTVWIGVAGTGEQHATLHHFTGTRSQIRQTATEAALRDLLCFVQCSVS